MARNQPTEPNARAVVASAKIVQGPGVNGIHNAKPKAWQTTAWAYFDAIGEVKQAGYFLANTMSLVRLFIAERPVDEQAPAPPEQTEGQTPPGYAEAVDALERLSGAAGGHGWLLSKYTLNAVTAGEGYLVGYPEVEAKPPDRANPNGTPAEPERWMYHSVSELVSKGEGENRIYEIKGGPDDSKPKPLPAGALVIRMWQEHPQFGNQADSALSACLAECDELLILSRTIRAAARSRLAGAGMLILPNEFSFGPDDEGEEGEGVNGEGDAFDRKLQQAMTAPIQDEGVASAVVPITLRGPAEHIDKVKHLTFDRPLDPVAADQRKELLTRLMNSLDIPVEQVMGMAGVNHWTAWQVDQATWTRYGQPKASGLCEQLSSAFLRPMLEEAGLAREVAERWMVWFDPAGAIADADRSDVAFKSHDRLLISDETARTELGYSDADAPDDAEVARRIEQGLPGTPPSSQGGPPNEGAPPSGPQSRIHRVFSRLRREPVVASARPAIGVRLAAIDRVTRARLEEAAHAALRRALEKAGSRVRTRASRRPDMRAMVSTVTAAEVIATLGAERVGLLATEDELLDGDMPELQARFDSNVRSAQARTRALLAAELDLDDDELAAIERDQDRDRRDAWVWLAAALTALAKQRLYDPRPAAPPAGEFDADALVPPSLIREAMARAGGDPGPTFKQGNPPGGIGTGELVQRLWAEHGRVVSGWTWVYGDAASRTSPFESHADLDGIEFATWTDEQLAVRPGDEWLGVDFYRPADHPWCQCDFAPIMLDVPADAGAMADA